MSRKIRALRRFAASMHALPHVEERPLVTDIAVSEADVRAFIGHIAATGFYEDEKGHLQPASADQRQAACDFIDNGDTTDTGFLSWARERAQVVLHGQLQEE